MAAYRKQVVTFLDIMGFREIVKAGDVDRITRMLDLIQAKAAAPNEGNPNDTSVISFSDSVIRARPGGTDAVGALMHEVNELATAQWELMEFGILVRGGMTYGDVLMAPARAFGPAFVRAYELEANWARSPRVVLDPRTVEHIRDQAAANQLVSRRKLLQSVRASIILDQDGLWFIDYIGVAHRRLGREQHQAAMARLRETIISEANALKPESAVWAKYLWLIRYFNGARTKFYKNEKGLKIQRSDVPFADELLIPVLTIKKSKASKSQP